jgi:hypothetical protein
MTACKNSHSGIPVIVWLQRTIVILIGLLLFLPSLPVQADMGPKPTLTFIFEYKIPAVDIVSGVLIECDDSACQNGKTLTQVGPQNFTCSASSCESLSYGYTEYQKLGITFSDRVRESNVFTKKAYNAKYIVVVLQDSLQVSESSSLLGRGCCPSLGLTLVLETLLASIYLSVFHLPRTALGWAPVASLVTLPFVWAVFPLLSLPDVLTTGLSESFAFLVESAFLFFVTNRVIPLRHAVALSLAMNAFSFTIGLITV